MKQLLTATMLLFISCSLSAQLTVNDSVNISRERWRDSLFRVDKSQILTGFLTEYSLSPFETSKYDGINGNDDTLKQEGEILMLHNLLQLSKVNSNATINPTDSLYQWATNHYNSTQQIPFVFLFKSYNRMRQTALSEGLFTIAADSVGILDASGRTTSPYDAYKIFAFAPFKTTITQFNAIHFAFPASLWETGTITNLSINFGDGAGFRTINQNDSINIYYATEGTKTLTAQITVSGTTYTAYSTITYARPSSFSIPSYQWTVDTTKVYSSIDDYLGNTITTMGVGSGTLNATTSANVEVENGCDGVLDKPVIIVEGFDTDGTLDIAALKARFRDQRFISTLKSYGYDIVYVDFKYNNDLIENNARVLEAIINKVNQVKTGTNKLSVIGYSMGGLVARWCLKDMEDRNLNHNVDKYFSYDAPHQGANVSLGIQCLITELDRDFPYLRFIKKFKNLVNSGSSAAARQMLVLKGNYNNGAYTYNVTVNTLDALREIFAASLQAKGYPQQTTNYAIAFGQGNNGSGTKNAGNGKQWGNFNSGDDILYTQIIDGFVNFTGKVYAVPENTTADVCKYRFVGFTYRKIFGFIPWISFNVRVRNFSYAGQYPYDDAPGGYVTSQYDFLDAIHGALGIGTTYNHDAQNFLPVVSALDLQNQSYSATNKWQSANMFYNIDAQIQNPSSVTGGNLSTTSLSPFAAVTTGSAYYSNAVTSGYNQWHLGGIQYQIADFILNKILGFTATSDCTSADFCTANPSISGPSVVCTNGQYTLTGLPSGISIKTIKWESMFGSFAITGGQGTNLVTISKVYDRADTLILSLTNSCGTTRQFKLGIQIGVPSQYGEIQDLYNPNRTNYCLISQFVTFSFFPYSYSSNNPSITNYYWGYYNTQTGQSSSPIQSEYSTDFYAYFSSSLPAGSYTIFVQPVNECGIGDINYKEITLSYGTCGGNEFKKKNNIESAISEDKITRISIYPNPVTNSIYITLPTDSVNLSKAKITITDISGRQVKQINTVSETNTIPVSTWANGTYVVTITDGKQKIVKKIVKN